MREREPVARRVAAGAFAVFSVLTLLMYGSGMVRPADPIQRLPVNPWLLAAVLAVLGAAAITQCPGS